MTDDRAKRDFGPLSDNVADALERAHKAVTSETTEEEIDTIAIALAKELLTKALPIAAKAYGDLARPEAAYRSLWSVMSMVCSEVVVHYVEVEKFIQRLYPTDQEDEA